MRDLHLYPDRQRGVLAESLTSAAAVTRITGFQNDTLKLHVHGGMKKRPPESLSTAPFVEEAWSFNALRASISVITSAGSVDVAPERGTFKLRVEDQTTTALTWPQPADTAVGLTATEIATFKAAVLAALKALSNIADNDITAADPLNAPVHTLYFAWTDPDDVRAIEIIEPLLQPPVEGEVGAVQSSPYVQFVKFVQLPIVITDDFEFPTAPVAAIGSPAERSGGAGVNEVQRLTIPEDGAFDLTWNGARTAVLSCAGLTAATIASALNAIVADGTSNPSFAVIERSARVFAIEFIGPLAAADQPLLVATMRQTASSLVAVAELPLTSRRFERALNGAKEVTLRFELVIDSAENTFQADFVMSNDATGPGTVQSAEEQLAVVTVTDTVYVPEDTLTPFITASAGFSFVPIAALAQGTHLNLTHNRGTDDINVVVLYADPASPYSGKHRRLKEGEFEWTAVSDNAAEVWFAFALSADTGSDFYFGKFKVYVYALDATLELVGGIELTGEQVTVEGQDLTDVIAALWAAIGMLQGNLNVPAGNIDGQISSTQIDINSFIDAINNAIAGDANTLATWNSMILNAITNPTLLEQLVAFFKGSETFLDMIRELLLAALASERAGGASVTISGIPSFTLVYPPSSTIRGPLVKTIVPAEIEDTSTDGIKVTYTGTKETQTMRVVTDYAPLSPAGNYSEGADLSADITLRPNSTVTVGPLTADATANTLTMNSGLHGLAVGDRVRVPATLGGLTAGTDYYVIASGFTTSVVKLALTAGGAAVDITGADATHSLRHYIADSGRVFKIGAGVDVQIAASDEGIDSSHPLAGEYVTFQNGHWFVVRKVDATWYATAYEGKLFEVPMSGDALIAGKRWQIVFDPTLLLASFANDIIARARIVIESAEMEDTEGAPLLESLIWTERASFRVFPSAAPGQVRGNVGIECRTVELDTCTGATDDVVTVATAHGLEVGNRVRFTTTGTLPAGLAVGVVYYVNTAPSGTTLTLSETLGGSTVNITDTGTGVHTIHQDAFTATAKIGGVSQTWTPASGFMALRARFLEFDPGPEPDTSPLALAGSLTVACEGATHSLVELT